MTAEQIDHLETWLQRNRQFTLIVKRHEQGTFLRIKAESPTEHDEESFYIPLDAYYADNQNMN